MDSVKKFDKSPRHLIKEADKGGAVTVLIKNNYGAVIYKPLYNQNIYQKLDQNFDPAIKKKLKKLLINKWKTIFTDKDFSYLNETDYNTSNFFGLPNKIHKSRLITNVIKEVVDINEPQDLTVRPIVRGPNCPNRKLSELIDTSLKPFLKHVKSYIRDSIDFLNKFDKSWWKHSYCNFWCSRPIHKHTEHFWTEGS